MPGFGTGGHVSLGLGNGDLTMDMDNPSSSITPGNPGEGIASTGQATFV